MRNTGAALVALLALGAGGPRADLTVTTDFEGGSAVVEAIDRERREVHVRPAGDPLRGWPCWWYLRIDGLAAGSAATVVVRGSERPARDNGHDTGRPLASAWALPDRAAVSHDGTTWTQTGPGVRAGERVSYPVTGTGGPVWIAWGPPFTARECDDLLTRAVAAAPRVTGSTDHPLWRQISGVWVAELARGDTVAACLETAWNTPHGTAAGYREVGARLGRAVADHLRARDSVP